MPRSSKKLPTINLEIPDWLPDWRDEKQYPTVGKTSRYQWAWEFLRRNPDYQCSWDNLIAPFYKDESFDHDAARRKAEAEVETDPHIQHALIENIPFTIIFSQSEFVFSKRFHLRPGILLHPSFPNAKFLSFEHDGITIYQKQARRYYRTEAETYDARVRLSDTQVLVAFDLLYPSEAQLKKVEVFLKGERLRLKANCKIGEVDSRSWDKKYHRYLRILDGIAAGATHAEMAAILFPF